MAEPIHLIRVDASLADELVRSLATPHPALQAWIHRRACSRE
jgi:hypothetical protein